MQIEKLMEEFLEIKREKAIIKEKEDQTKALIKLELENLKTDKYEDVNGTIVTCKESTRKSYDSATMKSFLSEEQLKEAYKETKFDTLRITTKEDRERMKSFIKK